MDGNVVGSGSDFIVIKKADKRFLIELPNFRIQELKKAVAPYGSEY